MKRRVAANKVLVDFETIDNNVLIERDEHGRVQRLVCITDLQVEPSSTSFYNGLITTEVDLSKKDIGVEVPSLVSDSLAVGYEGKLLLWQHLSLSDFKVTSETKVIEI